MLIYLGLIIYAIVDVDCTFACHAYSYNDSCPDIILTSQADADAWGICGNFTGNVIIEGNNLTNITLVGFQSIWDGNLIAANSSELFSISAPSLTTIVGNLTLSNLPLLADVDFPLLQSVAYGMVWDSLPLLTHAAIGNGISILPSENDGQTYQPYGSLSLVNTSCMRNDLSFESPHKDFPLICIDFFFHTHT